MSSAHSKNTISIPLWCDWNKHFFCFLFNGFLFLFHYGAIGISWQSTTRARAQTFLFHYGAIGIGAPTEGTAEIIMRKHFYSIMVRLEWERIQDTLVAGHYFYSIMVRLELSATEISFEPQQNFYSIMVRLEWLNQLKSLAPANISIPLWCDWNFNEKK